MGKDNIISINKFKRDTSVMTTLRRIQLADKLPNSTIIEIHKDGDKYTIDRWYGNNNFKILLDILTSGIDVETLRLDVGLEIDDSMQDDKDDLTDHINHFHISVITNDIPIFEIVFSQYFYKDGEDEDLAPITLIRSLNKPMDMYNPILDKKEPSDFIAEYTPTYNHNKVLSSICNTFENYGIVLDIIDSKFIVDTKED